MRSHAKEPTDEEGALSDGYRVEFVLVSAGVAAAATPMGTGGDDVLIGTDGRDTADARGGRDLVQGGPGDDGGMDGPANFGDSSGLRTDSSLDGDDVLKGGLGSDDLHGFGGDDLLAGGPGIGRIFAGEDRFDAMGPAVPAENPGADTVRGGAGDDFVIAADGRPDEIDCGPGRRDSAHYDLALDRVVGCGFKNRGT